MHVFTYANLKTFVLSSPNISAFTIIIITDNLIKVKRWVY